MRSLKRTGKEASPFHLPMNSENHFLKDVVDDYETYNTHIISQKEKQVVFLQMLNQYIDNINQDLSLTNNQLQNSKNDQREILKEITYLKNEIDDLVKTN